jgi:hypothetical protein
VARQGKQEFSADEGRCTQNTQMVRRGLPEMGHTLDFQARFVEIKQRAELPACCYLRVLRASSSVSALKFFLCDTAGEWFRNQTRSERSEPRRSAVLVSSVRFTSLPWP